MARILTSRQRRNFPMSHRELEHKRIRRGIKGFVVCRDCGFHVGDRRCQRLTTSARIWDSIPGGFEGLGFPSIQGEKFAIINSIQPPDQVPTAFDYSLDSIVGSKGETENYCCLVNQEIQLHVRQDDCGFPFTVHFEFRSDSEATYRHLGGHAGDWVAGNDNRFREKSRLTGTAYEQPLDLRI